LARYAFVSLVGMAWLRLLWLSIVMIDMAVDRYGLIGWLAIAWYAFVRYGLAWMDMAFYGEEWCGFSLVWLDRVD
jgi:hypothetical protein